MQRVSGGGASGGPIHDLAIELLQFIFVLARPKWIYFRVDEVSPSPFASSREFAPPYVCRLWRDICAQLPELVPIAHLQLSSTMHATRSATSRIREFFAMTAPHPLTLAVDITNSTCAHFLAKSLRRSFHNEAQRLRTLKLLLTAEGAPCLRTVSMPCLQDLRMTMAAQVSDNTPSDPVLSTVVFSSAPHLTRLRLSSFKLSKVSMPWSQIQDLTLGASTLFAEDLNILAQCPLRVLTLHDVHIHSLPVITLVIGPDGMPNTSNQTALPVTLPLLHTLNVYYVDRDDKYTMLANTLNYFITPALTSVAISPATQLLPPNHGCLGDLMQRSKCTILNVAVRYDYWLEQELLFTWLRALPDTTSLEVSYSPFPSSDSNCDPVAAWKIFADIMVDTDVMPRLHTLTLTSADVLSSVFGAGAELARMVGARLKAGHTLSTIRLGASRPILEDTGVLRELQPMIDAGLNVLVDCETVFLDFRFA
ncbi:hypothetical protein FISHEDRAFT_75615 [Fistulina hepatica ATCC 64428]|uniref:F-box domain-containing protein n=1 Tax=Fistulina hepatica ATCC 64428 TaxID=1128425 RepID=A0A0D7A955_9AGAR|nr:hypothetical protein FISHEDRAFT_75615 [Fistulina hepatica ATCC 64428]